MKFITLAVALLLPWAAYADPGAGLVADNPALDSAITDSGTTCTRIASGKTCWYSFDDATDSVVFRFVNYGHYQFVIFKLSCQSHLARRVSKTCASN